MSTLSEYLIEHLPDDWRKAHVVEALSGTVDRATVYRYLSGKHPRHPSDSVLEAFAGVLPGSSLVELRLAAGLAGGEEKPWVPPIQANRLNDRQRRALEAFIIATVESDDEPIDDDIEISLSRQAQADVQHYVEQLYASGRKDLADRVAASIAINSASETASRSAKD